jgi:hypothetical protein
LFVIRTSGDSVEIANDDKFEPLAWGWVFLSRFIGDLWRSR